MNKDKIVEIKHARLFSSDKKLITSARVIHYIPYIDEGGLITITTRTGNHDHFDLSMNKLHVVRGMCRDPRDYYESDERYVFWCLTPHRKLVDEDIMTVTFEYMNMERVK